MDDFDASEIEEFKTESIEMLDESEELLISLEKGASFLDCYNAIFRTFHSIKGAAGMLGWQKLQDHMHKVESQLTVMKSNEVFKANEVTYFLKAIDASRALLDNKEINFSYDIPNDTEDINQDIIENEPVVSQTDKKEQPEKKKINNGVIHLLDDEEDLLLILKSFLDDNGFAVKAFSDPLEYIEFFKTEQPDILLTDIKMPGMTGEEVLEVVKKSHPGLPVILLSGYVTKDIVINAISKGVFSVIEKPFNQGHVINICHNAIKKRRLEKLIKRTFDFIMFQFSDLEDYLLNTGQEDVRNSIKSEIKVLLDSRRELKKLNLVY